MLDKRGDLTPSFKLFTPGFKLTDPSPFRRPLFSSGWEALVVKAGEVGAPFQNENQVSSEKKESSTPRLLFFSRERG